MSLIGGILKGVTGPFRSIGYLAQGKVRKAVGALGDTGKLAAPILGVTGVGAPLAAAVGGVSGAASSWGRGQNNIGKIAMGGASGAAMGAGGAAARGLFAGAGGVGGSASLAGEGALTSSAIRAPSTLSAIGSFAKANPMIAAEAVKAPLSMYAAGQEGSMADDQNATQNRGLDQQAERDRLAEEERQRRFKLDQMGQFAGMMSSFRPSVRLT